MPGTALKLGPGVRLAEEGSADLVAEQDGRVVYEHGQVRICEVLEIPGDVDFGSGSIEACVDVAVHGTVRANFYVHTTKSLTVDRVIEAAELDVGGELTVHGGIFRREGMSRMRVGGNVSAQFLNELGLDAGGDVHFIKEILNSQVSAQGHLVGERGTIIGGEIYAREGIDVRVIGSEASVTTVVAVGTALDVLRRVRRMEREVLDLQKSVEKVRSAVQPLLADLKRLLPEQRQRAAELLCKANELESQVDDTQQEAQRILREGAPRGHPFVRAQDALYPGVRIRIGAREVYLRKLMHGPVKVELRKVKQATEVVAVNQRTGSLTVLPSSEANLDPPSTEDAKAGARDQNR